MHSIRVVRHPSSGANARVEPVTVARRLRIAAACGAAFVGLQATSCLPTEYDAYRFALDRCPDSAFALPAETTDGAYHVRPIVGYPLSHDGFAQYAVVGPFHAPYVNARLRRGARCEVDLVNATMPRRRLPSADVETIAHLLLRDADVGAVVPVGQVERLKASDVEGWMRRAAADTR
jgi:hypothetical protein